MISVVESAIEQGVPITAIAGLLNVAPGRFKSWYVEGLDDECKNPLYIDLAVVMEEARAKAIANGMRQMKLHGTVDWKAHHEALKVSDPETWNTASKVKVEQNVTVQRDLSNLTLEEVEELARLEDRILNRLPSDA